MIVQLLLPAMLLTPSGHAQEPTPPSQEESSQPAPEAAPEPVPEAAPEPAPESAPEPAPESAPEPVSESAPEPVSEDSSEASSASNSGQPWSVQRMFSGGQQTLGTDWDQSGRAFLTAYGGALGVFTIGGLGYALDSDAVVPLGLLGGLSGGAATYFLTSRTETTRQDAFYLSSMGVIGGWTGLRLAGSLIPVGAKSEDSRIFAAGILGATAGTSIGFLGLSDPPSAQGMLLRDTSLIVGSQVGHGAATLAGFSSSDGQRRPVNALRLAGGYTFYGVSTLLDRADAPLPSAALLTMNAGHGAWVGGWLPLIFNSTPSDTQHWSGLKMGLGLGYLSALGMAPALQDGQPYRMGPSLVGFASGTSIGAGIPLATGLGDLSNNQYVVPMLSGGILGHASGALISNRYAFSPEDLLLSGTLHAWAIYQSVGWGAVATRSDSLTDDEAAGYGLLAYGTGSLIASASPVFVDLSPSETAMAASGGLWGVWYGAWLGQSFSVDASQSAPMTLLSGNAALLTTTAIVSTGWDPSWEDVGRIDGMGLLGGALGAGVGVIASPNLQAAAVGSIVGSTTGLVGSAFLKDTDDTATAHLNAPTTRQPLWLPPRPNLTLPFQANWSVAPWQAEDGSTGGWVQLSAQAR